MEETGDKGWTWEDAESVVVPAVQAIAVYTNRNGDLVLRQEGAGYGDTPEDQFVIIPRQHVSRVIKAMRAEIAPTK